MHTPCHKYLVFLHCTHTLPAHRLQLSQPVRQVVLVPLAGTAAAGVVVVVVDPPTGAVTLPVVVVVAVGPEGEATQKRLNSPTRPPSTVPMGQAVRHTPSHKYFWCLHCPQTVPLHRLQSS